VKYRTIVADPPWPISEDHPVLGDVPYETMTLDEIAALPVKKLADNRDGDASLYLWTTSTHLFDTKAIAEAWGFKYVATLVWCKPPRGAGMGCAFTSNVEFLLYCRRAGFTSIDTREKRPDIAAVTAAIGRLVTDAGFSVADLNQWVGASDIGSWWTSGLPHRCAIPKPEHWDTLKRHVPALSTLDPQVAEFNARKGLDRKPASPLRARVDTRWFTWPRGRHSVKPDAFYDLVEQVSPGPYLELFARRQRLGWDTWGNEALNHVELSA
jgi:N6-adenosine-specific RNA methylase IME4